MVSTPKQPGILLYLCFICGNLTSGQESYLQFEKNWCRERTLRTDWRTYTHSCPSYARHWAYEIWSDGYKTHPNLSYISRAEINPAGHFSKVYIQSVSVLNRTKTFGGDAWRVRVHGPADLMASVNDMENGTYQAVFLPMEPGTYSLQIMLDYTLCHGLKNPPSDWFLRGCRHGSFQSPGTLTTSDDYIDRPLYYGAYFTIQVPPTAPQDAQYLDSLFNNSTQWCNEGCSHLWDGFGRWVNNNWLPYKPSDMNSFPWSGHRRGSGVLWIYGDSHNRRFYESLQRRQLCSSVFRACYHTDVWVYWLGPVNSNEMDLW